MIHEFHLSPRGKGGVACDGDGAFVGAIPILARSRQNGKDQWQPRDFDDLGEEMSAQYGLPIDMSSKRGGLRTIAKALNDGDVARAQVATLLLGIPDPAPLSKRDGSRDQMIKLIRDLHWSGMLKWDPDEHPRWPAGSADGKGGEFAPKGEGGEADGSRSTQSNATHSYNSQHYTSDRDARVQLADAGMSDAYDDPVTEAVRAAAAQRNRAAANSRASPAGRENFWEALGTRLTDDVKSALSRIGRAEIAESDANLAVGTEEAKAIARALRTYADYRAQPWIGPDGRPIEVPVINTGDPLSDQAALMGHELFEPNAPLTRPATNADWIDPLVNLASLAAMAAGPAFRSAGAAAEAADGANLSANALENASTLDQLSAAASRAAAKIGPGSGRFHGTIVHSAFRAEVDALENSNIATEQSCLNGRVVPYGTPQSIRVEVVEGPVDAPGAIYDLKTGKAILTSSRIEQIRSHLPTTTQPVPIHEVRP